VLLKTKVLGLIRSDHRYVVENIRDYCKGCGCLYGALDCDSFSSFPNDASERLN